VRHAGEDDYAGMTPLDYILDSALVLIVLLQIKERTLTTKSLVRPVVIVSIAVVNYLHGIPTAGNDLVLVGVLALTGGLIGIAAGQTLFMRLGPSGEVLSRAGWASAFFWILGMGGRFGFIFWINHGGQASLAHFSATHSITSAEAWTVALLAMAVAEVLGRTVLVAARRYRLQSRPALQLA
jgi:hypothetical protein